MPLPKSFRNYRFAFLAALSYGLFSPLGKLLLEDVSPLLLSSVCYLGAGTLPLLFKSARGAFFQGSRTPASGEAALGREDLPSLLLMVLLDGLAPALLFLGLSIASASTVALLSNFEIVATALIALVFFQEAVGRRLWLGIMSVTLGGALLSLEDPGTLQLSPGAILALGAAVLWGLENNLTRALSLKNPLDIVIVKGLGSGLFGLILALVFEKLRFDLLHLLCALLLGFVSVGLSVFFYIRAQRELGAARTGSVYALNPFFGVLASFLILSERPEPTFYPALAFMLLGVFLALSEKHSHFHAHAPVTHEHPHVHGDPHHRHEHLSPEGRDLREDVASGHSHVHTHAADPHVHEHSPDIHHRHPHEDEEDSGNEN
ncbi:MAG: EamA family transporter [Deltaproteobacteria bacterium]|jgi:drug/metabolite transporter (DMT)-like permease|nr:EamA family transporter [Deltaproteobacteria bacterium]